MKQFYFTLCLLCLLFWWNKLSFAQTPPVTPDESQKAHCPEIKDIVKDPKTKLWGVGDWASNEEASFEEELVSFQGAEWVGVGIGKIICAYKGNHPSSFLIPIQNTNLAYDPAGPNWGKYEDGRKKCPALTSGQPVNVNDCPFYFRKEETPKDIYKQLDFFKKKKD